MKWEEDNYRIFIDGDWELEDLYTFPKTYEQVYYLVYSLLPHEGRFANDRIMQAYSQYPWGGGYSAVNFYNKLKYTCPKQQRPKIKSIQYASPGWIDLILISFVAKQVESIVNSVCNSIKQINATYTEIYKGLQDRKLLRMESEIKALELEKAHSDYILHSAKNMAKSLGFNDIAALNQKTGSPIKTLKILLSLYRRIRILVEYQNKGKVQFNKVALEKKDN